MDRILEDVEYEFSADNSWNCKPLLKILESLSVKDLRNTNLCHALFTYNIFVKLQLSGVITDSPKWQYENKRIIMINYQFDD